MQSETELTSAKAKGKEEIKVETETMQLETEPDFEIELKSELTSVKEKGKLLLSIPKPKVREVKEVEPNARGKLLLALPKKENQVNNVDECDFVFEVVPTQTQQLQEQAIQTQTQQLQEQAIQTQTRPTAKKATKFVLTAIKLDEDDAIDDSYMICACGAKIKKSSKSAHLKSKKHLESI